MANSQKRIMLWAVPRSLSTAMCRVMLNSGLKTQILFEAYGLSYYFGPERVSERYSDVPPVSQYSYDNAKRQFELPYTDKELVFAKDMPYYLGQRMTADWIPDGYTHTFITRHPLSTVLSYMRVIDKDLSAWGSFDPTECGYREQVDILRLLQQQGHRVIVLDSDDLMDKPEEMLRAYCREIGLEFKDSMINWQPLPDKEFMELFCGMWEPEWFSHVRTATKLNRKPKRSNGQSYDHYDQETCALIEKTVEENMKYYEELHSMRLIV